MNVGINKAGNKLGAIIGGVIGGILFIIILIIVSCYYWRKKTNKNTIQVAPDATNVTELNLTQQPIMHKPGMQPIMMQQPASVIIKP